MENYSDLEKQLHTQLVDLLRWQPVAFYDLVMMVRRPEFTPSPALTSYSRHYIYVKKDSDKWVVLPALKPVIKKYVRGHHSSLKLLPYTG
jgi:hypothetical protein